jgi:orotidine-5'-phosphate decarboxylase
MLELKDKLIVALDVATLEKAASVVEQLSGKVKFFKIGSQLFTAYGPKAVEMVAKKGGRVFLDLKFHDIPNTASSATASGTSICTTFTIPKQESTVSKVKESTVFPVFMMTVHIQGGIEMLKKAVEGATLKAKELNIDKPLIVGVTTLTSQPATEKEVLGAAIVAKEAGLDGVVCSPHEAKKIREQFGENFIIVTPGIRPKGYSADDQKRTATAQEAIEAGASFIVVGRPILEARDPLRALNNLLD